MARVVSLGECMVEMAPTGEGTYAMGFAGDTLNTAWYLRRHLPPEVAVDYATVIGRDALSDRMLAFFREAGLGTDHVARHPDRTVGLYLIQLDNGERSFAYWRSAAAARTLAEDPARLDRALAGARLVYVSGITLAILPAQDRGTLLDAIGRARTAGATVAFDPNLRPRLWESAEAMRDAVTRAARHADILLPSFDDEARHFGDPDPAATARRYGGLGATLVAVKNAEGEIAVSDRGQLSMHPPARVEKVVDTTAAGDSFNAGLLAAWLQGTELSAAVQAGAALAARVIGARGALVPA